MLLVTWSLLFLFLLCDDQSSFLHVSCLNNIGHENVFRFWWSSWSLCLPTYLPTYLGTTKMLNRCEGDGKRDVKVCHNGRMLFNEGTERHHRIVPLM